MMFPSRAKTGLLLLGFLTLLAFGLMSVAGGDEPKKDDPAAADKEKIDTKATPRPSAAAIKFRKELALPLSSLSTLGSRIDSARRAHDPVALAHTANELATAEKVSGKKASLTSTSPGQGIGGAGRPRRQDAELRADASGPAADHRDGRQHHDLEADPGGLQGARRRPTPKRSA